MDKHSMDKYLSEPKQRKETVKRKREDSPSEDEDEDSEGGFASEEDDMEDDEDEDEEEAIPVQPARKKQPAPQPQPQTKQPTKAAKVRNRKFHSSSFTSRPPCTCTRIHPQLAHNTCTYVYIKQVAPVAVPESDDDDEEDSDEDAEKAYERQARAGPASPSHKSAGGLPVKSITGQVLLPAAEGGTAGLGVALDKIRIKGIRLEEDMKLPKYVHAYTLFQTHERAQISPHS